MGKDGAGYLWDLRMPEKELRRTSLTQPQQWEGDDNDSSEEASVATVEDAASDAVDPPEGAAEVLLYSAVAAFVHPLL